jgi:apolipoprotein N-acyltransferase
LGLVFEELRTFLIPPQDVEDWMEQVTLPANVAKIPEPAPVPKVPGKAAPLRLERVPWWAAFLRLYAPPLATAALLWACFFPLAWGWLAWVALVPLLALVRHTARPWAVYFSALVGGLAFYLTVLRWMPVADDRMYATWGALGTYCALYLAVTVFLVRWLERRTPLPLMVTLPAVWTSLEFFRSFFGTGFAWYFLGHTQHQWLQVIQMCDLGGVHMVTFLLAAVNAWGFEVLYAQGWFRSLLGLREPPRRDPLAWPRWRWLAVQGGVAAALVVAALGYGQYRLDEDTLKPGPQIALLQGNLDQRLRNEAHRDRSYTHIKNHYGALHLVGASYRPQLIVWPETSCPQLWLTTAGTVPIEQIPVAWADEQKFTQNAFREFTTFYQTDTLFGLETRALQDVTKPPARYNSALLINRHGGTGQRYDKIHRVPFGEYVPLKEWLPFMNGFAPYDFDYSITAGERLTRFELGQYTFGVVICYEDSDPFLARQYGVNHPDGKAVDFLINISNDGWFAGSSEHEEHLALCRFRAIEARRSVARSVNMGISAIIDSTGRVQKPQEDRIYNNKTQEFVGRWLVKDEVGRVPELPVSEWGTKKKVAAVLVAHVPIDSRTSLYAVWGDWLPIGGWALLGLVFAWSVGRRFVGPRPGPTSKQEVKGDRGTSSRVKEMAARPGAAGGGAGADLPGSDHRVAGPRKPHGLPGDAGG